MRHSPATRICIIGAGAAGLTAAETLKDLGYPHVTLLEKQAAAGGKCRSIVYEGRPYELGAGIVAANDVTVNRLAAKAGVTLKPVKFGTDNLYDPDAGGACRDILSVAEEPAFLWQLLLRYRRLCIKHAALSAPGFARLDAELCMPFAEWAETQGIELVARNFERFFTGFGYGYWDEIPAAYVLKYYSWETLKSYVRRGIYTFPDGIQHLWCTLAARHDVRYGIDLKSLVRDDRVKIELGNERLEFDIVLLACPLDEALDFLDGSEEEEALFSQIRYVDYRTCACKVAGFVGQTGFIPANFRPSKKGQPVFWYKRYGDSDVYTFYAICDWATTQQEISANIEVAVRKLGGELRQIIDVMRWKYFPHVGCQAMREGYFDRLESLQGRNRTYYIGELLNFSTVEMTSSYAESLIAKNF